MIGARRRSPASALLAGAGLLSLLAGAGLPACDPVPLRGKGCPCVGQNFCCEGVCLPLGGTCVNAGPWPPFAVTSEPLPLDDVTVYAFSQADTSTSGGAPVVGDPQVGVLVPDMVIRGWAQWAHWGTFSQDYDFAYVRGLQAQGVRFMGGATASAFVPDTATDPGLLADITTRDAAGNMVVHDDIYADMRRATLANPRFRQMLIDIGKLQIDGDGNVDGGSGGGVDGLHFEEVNGVYQGLELDGNEGFDDYHLADFNAYLLAKYPGADFATKFDMAPDNLLRADLPAGDLAGNFNYRKYLQAHGWTHAATIFADANPLAVEWGRTTINRPTPGMPDFVNSAEPYRYWRQVVEELRAYARRKGRQILVTAEGIYPFVDFQSVGLDLNNTDSPSHGVVNYVPATTDGHLDGTQKLQDAFRRLRNQSQQLAPGAPVVLFLDGRQKYYDAFPCSLTEQAVDRQDYWRIYAAEAYANGLFFAFHLRSSVGKDMPPKQASDCLGVMELFATLKAFYKGHASFYHHVTVSPLTGPAPPDTTMAITDQPGRRLVHVVNHDYDHGLNVRHDVPLTIPVDAAPERVWLASPDQAADVELSLPQVSDGVVSLTLPTLEAYDVVVIEYAAP